MAEWTPEAGEYLDGYLHQVAALVRQQGDDAEDIVDGLRDHITREAESSAGAMVTLDMLRKTLAVIGTPEQVAEGEGALAPAPKPDVQQAAQHPQSPPPPSQPPQVIVQQAPRSRTGCWIFAAVALVPLVFLGIPVILGIVAALFAHRQPVPVEPAPVAVMTVEEASEIIDESMDANSPLSVARAFFEALAAADIDAALEMVHPDEREKCRADMEEYLPPIPKDFELEREPSGIGATQFNVKDTPFGVDLKNVDGRWWVTL